MNKRELREKIIAWILTFAMVLTTVNLPALKLGVRAEETETEGEEEATGGHTHRFTYTVGDDENTIIATCSDKENCTFGEGDNKGVVTITLKKPKNLEYDGSKKVATIDGYPEPAPENLAEKPTIYHYKLNEEESTDPINAGDYKAMITWGEKPVSVEFTIEKKKLSASDFEYTSPENLSYDGQCKEAKVEAKDINLEIKYYSDEGCTQEASPKDYGTYYVGITTESGDNYEAASEPIHDKNWKFDIAKASAPELTDEQKPTVAKDLNYTGNAQNLVDAPKKLPEGYTIQYSVDDGKTWTDDIPTGRDAGEYTVKVKYIGDGNHENFEGTSIEVIISKASAPELTDEQKPTVAKDLNYTGNAQNLVDAPKKLPEGYTIQYSVDNEKTWTDNIPTETDAGEYTVKVKYIGDGNHENFEGTSITVTIGQAQLSYENLPVNQKPRVKILEYTGKEQELVEKPKSLPDGYTIQYSVDDGKTWTDDIPTGRDAKDYTVKAKYKGSDNNYVDFLSETITVTIEKATLKINAGKRYITFGESDKSLTYTATGFVNGETKEKVLNGSLEREQGNDAGTYKINQGSLKANGNYKIEYKSADYEIIAKNITADMFTWDGDSTFTYNAKEESVKVSAKDSARNSALIQDTDYTLSGAQKGTDAGSYTLTITGKGNYKGEITKDWIINKAVPSQTLLTYEVTAYCGDTYGDIEKRIKSTGNITGDFTFDYKDGLTAGSVVKAIGGANVVTATFTPSGNDADNYEKAEIGIQFTPIHDLGQTANFNHSEKVNATEEKVGSREHYQCKGCGTYFDSNKKEVSEDYLVIPYVASSIDVTIGKTASLEDYVVNGKTSVVSTTMENEDAYKKYLTYDSASGTITTKKYYKTKYKTPVITVTDKAGDTYTVNVNLQIAKPSVKVSKKSYTSSGGVKAYTYTIKYSASGADGFNVIAKSGLAKSSTKKALNKALKTRVKAGTKVTKKKASGKVTFTIAKSSIKGGKISFQITGIYGKNKSVTALASK